MAQMRKMKPMQQEQLKISDSLRSLARIGVILLEEVVNGPGDPALERETEESCSKLRKQYSGCKPAEIEALDRARRLYRRTGVDPTRERPSSERLLRRVLKGHPLAKINTLVDCINLVSLELQCPLGLYDLESIAAPAEIRIGCPGDHFRGIHDRIVNLEGKPVAVDQEGPFGNPSYDSHRTRVGTGTTKAMVLCWTPLETPLKYIRKVQEELARRTAQYCQGTTGESWII